MSNELKPVLKTEELELIFEKLEAYGCEEGDDVHKLLLKLSHSIDPLYEIPEGYQLVPIEPTKAMRLAFHDADEEFQEGDSWKLTSPDHQWKAMLKAAKEQGE